MYKMSSGQAQERCSAVPVSAVGPSNRIGDPCAMADLGGGWDFQNLSASLGRFEEAGRGYLSSSDCFYSH